MLPEVLESFAGRPSTQEAYGALCAAGVSRVAAALPPRIVEECGTHGTQRGRVGVQIVGNRVLLTLGGATEGAILSHGAEAVDPWPEISGRWDLTGLSRCSPVLLHTLVDTLCPERARGSMLSFTAFASKSKQLKELGCLSPMTGAAPGTGSSRNHPECPFFGLSRGTPVGRQYLDQFITESREAMIGNTLEIGGVAANRDRYGLALAESFLTVDVNKGSGAEICGDVHDPSLFAPESFDSILAFNVLEHCPRPWDVVANVYRWLKPRGTLFCMVSNAQRVHRAPRDYWRPLPDGVAALMAAFAHVELRVYGNLTTTIASLRGLAAEELDAGDFTWHDSRYPVATCVRAGKQRRAAAGSVQ
jgi:SAM-dependent methyltransferase